jgi:hypothetical protein
LVKKAGAVFVQVDPLNRPNQIEIVRSGQLAKSAVRP